MVSLLTMMARMGRLRKSSYTEHEFWNGQHRFEHWYRDNSVYFITARTRDGIPMFETERARGVFWDRRDHNCGKWAFVPWVTSLLNNHFHTLGYLKVGENLAGFMRQLHGSVAMMVMKETGIRHVPFRKSRGNKDYFDGWIRDVLQAQRAYRYTLMQAVRAGLVRDWRDYSHTRVNVKMEPAIRRAVELNAFLEGVPYARYDRRRKRARTWSAS